ncbi:hypothetical protein SAMN05421823_103681 [Catalinimonas alkaloidigena]|uniref:DUF3592 domain-containing protein n=1 Tax=Catalinimonas alkaloidigena TaxID=1075417 RepID=A0A1G9F5J8_9BACT|nr:DUF3592 domain-containing protein [Catalinimonas alkaloidigena]SDK83719.1 hypothetical protein SAMN05421823_103681 [Catalinimonas alkaloidigena]
MENIFLLFGIALVGIGLYWLVTDFIHVRNGFQTRGRVVKVIRAWKMDAGQLRYSFAPVVQFQGKENQAVERPLETCSNPPVFFEGQSLDVVYYDDKLYPTGSGWKVLYALTCVLGLGLLITQLF